MSPVTDVSPIQGANLSPIDTRSVGGVPREVSESEEVSFQNMMVGDAEPPTDPVDNNNALANKIIDSMKESLGEVGFQRAKENWMVTGITDEEYAISYNSFIMGVIDGISRDIDQIKQANSET